MGFRVQIEADYLAEVLSNIHPDGKPSGGKAVLAFLAGLEGYALSIRNPDDRCASLEDVDNWYRYVELQTGLSFFPTCQSLLDCMWGDGGDPMVYREDEYAFYVHRCDGHPSMTEAQFVSMVRDYDKHWQSIADVIAGVQLLLKMFEDDRIESLEGFYVAEDTIPDFEALEANLLFLARRKNESVRLNFR